MNKALAATYNLMSKDQWAMLILGILYIVGVFGVTLPIHPEFMRLTPVNLLLCFGIALYCQQPWSRSLGYALLISLIAGWSIEVLGVKTGLLFGEYQYGATLGPKLLDTPLMMTVNWTLLIYAVVSMGNRWLGTRHALFKSALGASLMTGYDIFLEPAAVHYDFWSWAEAPYNSLIVAPLQNYAMWWLAAFLLIWVFHLLAAGVKNKVIEFLFFIQLVFFIWIYWVVL